MSCRLGRLFHLAEADNLDSILEHGLLSTETLVAMANGSADGNTILRTHRPSNVRLSSGVVIRDQAPMPPAALAAALDDGLAPADWYALLNRFVFLWPDRDRMERHRKACGTRPQVVLTFDGCALLERLGDSAFVSPINSGNARRKPARRSSKTFVPYRRWEVEGWPTGTRSRPPAEILFATAVPTTRPFLLAIDSA